MKSCTKCGQEKSFDLFARKAASKDGLSPWCKTCFASNARAKYQGSAEQARKSVNKEKVRARARDFIWSVLSSSECVDCGESDPLVLEFDHRDDADKVCDVSAMQDNSTERISAEIAKCEVRCANCHRRRTIGQFGFWRGRM